MTQWSIGQDDARERLLRAVEQEWRGMTYAEGPSPTPLQVAAVLHALADYTALQQAVEYRPGRQGGEHDVPLSVGRWLHDLGDYVHHRTAKPS